MDRETYGAGRQGGGRDLSGGFGRQKSAIHHGELRGLRIIMSTQETPWDNLERYKRLLEMRELTVSLQNSRIKHLKRTIELLRAEIREIHTKLYGNATKL